MFEEAEQKWTPAGTGKDVLLNCKISRGLDEKDRDKIKQLSSRPDAEIFREALNVTNRLTVGMIECSQVYTWKSGRFLDSQFHSFVSLKFFFSYR